MKKVAIIGAGLQAKRRTPAILEDPNYEVKWVVDLIPERAKKLATQANAQSEVSWKKVLADNNLDVVLVLTYPNSHAEISIAAMNSGKDVLCEKPIAKTEKEAQEMVLVAKQTKKILKTGFNHRHHPAISEAYRLFKQNIIGKPVFGRGRYGIAGRKGLEKEWRSDPNIIIGGQFMDQGIHLVDLFRWFLGDVEKTTGFVSTNYWPISPQEDNGFALLHHKHGVTSSIHSSLTQWINLFEFEIYGEKGSLTVNGLGGTYGVEKLTVSLHDANGPFSYQTTEFRGNDISWKKDWEEFTAAVESRKEPEANSVVGLETLKIVNAVYLSSKTDRAINLKK
ncbi:MAG TPA: Gfo/Idh/MocA family oxidoreductase [Candidatus Saccharimonadales bacterium]|nr:Gfo/Idh/MocA family oxidoreductase [Candidatus Saccharimonadales bacterium]